MTICHRCGSKIDGEGVPVRVDTYTVRVHVECRHAYGKSLTARAIEQPWRDYGAYASGDPQHAYVLPGEVNLDPDEPDPDLEDGDDFWPDDDQEDV